MKPIPHYLLPDSSNVVDGRLHIGGVDVLDLAGEYGTPLFVYDEEQLRAALPRGRRRLRRPMSPMPPRRFSRRPWRKLAHEEGMQLDVATGGELLVALHAGVPADRLGLHGNNKSEGNSQRPLDAGVGQIVVDSFDEIDRIEALVAAGATRRRSVLVRITPGVEAHTHEYLQTGITDSKFGFSVESGDRGAAIERACRLRRHAPRGRPRPYRQPGVRRRFLRRGRRRAGADVRGAPGLDDLSIGGGLGVAYVAGETAPSITRVGR